MERRMRNIKVSVIIARGLAQWRSEALRETKIGQIHQLHSMCVPLMRRCCMGAHTLKAGFKRKLSELIPQRSVLEKQREADTLRNVGRRLENMQ